MKKISYYILFNIFTLLAACPILADKLSLEHAFALIFLCLEWYSLLNGFDEMLVARDGINFCFIF